MADVNTSSATENVDEGSLLEIHIMELENDYGVLSHCGSRPI